MMRKKFKIAVWKWYACQGADGSGYEKHIFKRVSDIGIIDGMQYGRYFIGLWEKGVWAGKESV